MELSKEILLQLSAEFPAEEIEFLPRAASGGMALGLPYLESRDVMRRLDAVVGPENWKFDFEVLHAADKTVCVRGMLTVCGVTKCEAGEANGEDEPVKSAVSDAIKRCGVLFGIGRYLYYLPRVWAPFDPQKRRFIEQPRLDPAAVRRALALCGVGISTQSNPRQEAPTGPLASPQEARANREAERRPSPPVDSAGDRAATRQPAAPQQNAFRPPAPTPETRPQRPPVTDSSVGNLHCSRPECAKPITKQMSDVSQKNFGRDLCPPCQKLVRTQEPAPAAATETPAANGREKSPLETARGAYMAKLNDVFGKLEDRQRYAIEAVLLEMPEPLQKGSKDEWSAEDWRNFRNLVEQCDVKQTLEKAKALVNVNRVLDAPSSQQPAFSGLANS
jgi:hypothetical protein